MSYETEITFAKELAREAGEIMRRNFSIDIEREWKNDNTPVTAADTTINSMVIDKIAKHFPNDAVIGEEQSRLKDSPRKWVCDPVDGTMAFSHGLPISTFSLALTENGSTVLGVVYDPFMDRQFSAIKNQGAFLNDVSIKVSSIGFENALIDIEGFPGSKAVVNPGPEFSELLKQRGSHVTTIKSVILPAALVAAGQFAAAVFNVPKPEDGAAIKVIVEEAGGKVTDLFGEEQPYDRPTKGFIASNGAIHQQLVDLIRQSQ